MATKTKPEVPNIRRWYNHGDGFETIVDRLVGQYGYTQAAAIALAEEIIYG